MFTPFPVLGGFPGEGGTADTFVSLISFVFRAANRHQELKQHRLPRQWVHQVWFRAMGSPASRDCVFLPCIWTLGRAWLNAGDEFRFPVELDTGSELLAPELNCCVVLGGKSLRGAAFLAQRTPAKRLAHRTWPVMRPQCHLPSSPSYSGGCLCDS